MRTLKSGDRLLTAGSEKPLRDTKVSATNCNYIVIKPSGKHLYFFSERAAQTACNNNRGSDIFRRLTWMDE